MSSLPFTYIEELIAGLTKGKKKTEDDQQKLSKLELLKRVQHAII